MISRPFAVVAIAALAAACSKSEGAGDEEAVKPVVTASTFTVAIEPFTRTVSGIGTVVARADHYAALSAPSPTRIAKVYVNAGQRVGVGTPLVEFEQVGFNAATSAAQAALTAAQKNYERAQRLANEGILPRKDAEQAAAELGKARTEAVTAQRAQQLSVMRSPISGVVSSLRAVIGASADAGQVLVEVADPRGFDVVLNLSTSDAASVLPGARVLLSAGEKGGGEALGEGRVASVGVGVDTISRAVAIRVVLSTPKRGLRLGESVYGEIGVSTKQAVVIPADALVPGEEVGTYKVFVVDAKGLALEREVTIGGRTEDKVEIVEGLKGGEKVVTKGAFAVEDSSHVTAEVPVKDAAKAAKP